VAAKAAGITLGSWNSSINETAYEFLYALESNDRQRETEEIVKLVTDGTELAKANANIIELQSQIRNLTEQQQRGFAALTDLSMQAVRGIYALSLTDKVFTCVLGAIIGLCIRTIFGSLATIIRGNAKSETSVVLETMQQMAAATVNANNAMAGLAARAQPQTPVTSSPSASTTSTTLTAPVTASSTTTTNDGYAEAKYQTPSPGPRPNTGLIQRAVQTGTGLVQRTIQAAQTIRAPVSVLNHTEGDLSDVDNENDEGRPSTTTVDDALPEPSSPVMDSAKSRLQARFDAIHARSRSAMSRKYADSSA